MLFATKCPVCLQVGPAPCSSCIQQLARGSSGNLAGLDSCTALLSYVGAARAIVAGFKYGNARSTLPWLAVNMASLVDPSQIDVVTWVPTTKSRKRQRGFDHAQILATAIARRLDKPRQRMIGHAGSGAQTGRSRKDRRNGPELFLCHRVKAGARVLLVDDVMTTGASLQTAARLLRAAGASHVHAVVAAETPLKRGAQNSDIITNEFNKQPRMVSPRR